MGRADCYGGRVSGSVLSGSALGQHCVVSSVACFVIILFCLDFGSSSASIHHSTQSHHNLFHSKYNKIKYFI